MNLSEQIILPDGHVALAADSGITKLCCQAGRLDWDQDFAALPEVRSLAGKTVLDVGAYIGDTTLTFLNVGARVFAFEPQPDAYACLVRNCPQAICIPAAVGDGRLDYSLRTTGGNMGGRPLILEGPYTSLRLDDFVLPPVDFLKIDVEGFEMAVLRGASWVLRQYRPVLHLEVNPRALGLFGHTEQEIMDCLKVLNFAHRETYRYGQENWDLLCVPQ